MKKKLFGTILAAALVVTQAISVFAVGSKTAEVALAGDSVGKYNVQEISAETMPELAESAPEVLDKIQAVNAGTATVESIAELAPDLADQLADKSLLTKFVDVTPGENAVKTEDGKYQVTLSVPGLTAAASDVAVLHYSTQRSVWEIITPSNVDVQNKEITAEFQDLSPVAVIAKVDAAAAVDNAAGTAPKTGVASNWALFMGAAVVLLAAAGFAVKKSR